MWQCHVVDFFSTKTVCSLSHGTKVEKLNEKACVKFRDARVENHGEVRVTMDYCTKVIRYSFNAACICSIHLNCACVNVALFYK